MFSVAAYKPYFDVDTSDVVERIWESVFPFRGTFTEKTSENPDLYARISPPSENTLQLNFAALLRHDTA
jgi:hypothetical protein